MIRIYADSKAEPVRCTNRRRGIWHYVGFTRKQRQQKESNVLHGRDVRSSTRTGRNQGGY
ncbi:hypothetical protein NXW89_19380 [Bacteroides thetaiotaomicron]|nr:hypothetical protein [Bacteroides thetaiotaomicron]